MKTIISKIVRALPYVLLALLPTATGWASTYVPQIPNLSWTPRSDWINVKTTGSAVGDGVTDDTAAIQYCLNLISTTATKHTVYFPPGIYLIKSTLMWNSGTNGTYGGPYGVYPGCAMIGSGGPPATGTGGSTILWGGTAGGTMFWSDGAPRSRYIGLTWNGNGTAAYGVNHNLTIDGTYGEAEGYNMRHQYEAFQGFTVAGINSTGSVTNPPTDPTSEMAVWNCLFTSCTTGIVIGLSAANNYDWHVDGCEFDNCGTGIYAPFGKSLIYDTHFQNTKGFDIYVGYSYDNRVRRCSSIGSGAFFGVSSGRDPHAQVVQDCHIDSWTSTSGAIQINSIGPVQVLDCVFTNPPTTTPPIYVTPTWGGEYATDITLSGNYCSNPAVTQLINSGTAIHLDTIPCGYRGNTLTSASTHFLSLSSDFDPNTGQLLVPDSSCALLDVPGTFTVSGTNYHAYADGSHDDTSALQAAINWAESNAQSTGTTTIVYLPETANNSLVYKITSPLIINGTNVIFEGGGIYTTISGTQSNMSTVLTVTSPQNVAIKDLSLFCSNTTAGMTVTSTASCDLRIDDVYDSYGLTGTDPDTGARYGNCNNSSSPGVLLKNLPAGSSIFIEVLNASLTVNGCGAANIFGKFVTQGHILVEGAGNDTGLTGVLMGWIYNGINFPVGQDPLWDVTVTDNQSLIMGDMYCETNANHVLVSSGTAVAGSSGMVTIGNYKDDSEVSAIAVSDSNYCGTLYYGNCWFKETYQTDPLFLQSGTNPYTLILAGNSFDGGYGPAFTSTNSLIGLQNIQGNTDYLADQLPAGSGTMVALSFDQFRKLGAYDLQFRYGIGNTIFNSSAELDPVNSSPNTSLGTVPSGWTLSGAILQNGGCRNAVVTGTASPFGPGAQCFDIVDSTGTGGTGSRLQFSQFSQPLSASQGAVFSFDFNLSVSATASDVWIRAFDSGTSCTFLKLEPSRLEAFVGGIDTVLTAVTPGTWYRVQVAIPAPANGKASAMLYLSKWTSTGAVLVNSWPIDGSPGTLGLGLNEVYINTGVPGENIGVLLDNITLVSGDPLLGEWPGE